jgi:hypothetical protein
MGRTRLAITVFVIAMLFVSVIVGTVVYYYIQAHEEITFVDVDYLSYGAPTQKNYNYKWMLTLDLKNTGNTNATITNIIMDEQSYDSFNPIPIVNPPIENGYVLSPNQNVTITVQGTNTTTTPNVYAGRMIYIVTATGNYSTFVDS